MILAHPLVGACGWGVWSIFWITRPPEKGEVGYVLLQGRIVEKGGDYFLDYLLSRRLRPAMCCSKDLTPKPLLFLLLRAPSSLTGVDASCLSLQSCGEPRLLLSDLYCKWTQHGEEMKIKTLLSFETSPVLFLLSGFNEINTLLEWIFHINNGLHNYLQFPSASEYGVFHLLAHYIGFSNSQCCCFASRSPL